MLVRIFIVAVFLSPMVTGQTEDFQQECSILKTLDNFEARLQKQETLVEQQTTRLQQQENQLLQQDALLKNQTGRLEQHESLVGQQSTLLQQQQTIIEQQTTRLREQEEKIAALKQPQTDCGVLYRSGTTQSGVYAISPDRKSPFDVYCGMTDGGWTVIQRRIDGAVNFTRTWDEYVQGFGDVNGEYWLGLEKIYRLTKYGAEIYFDIGNYDGTRDYAHYKNFTVHGATTLYKMNVDAYGYNGSIGELFGYHDDTQFSTYDRDNDLSRANCAQENGGGGGWWYRTCAKIGYFNGKFGKKQRGGIGCFTPSFVYLKTVTIKLKQRP